MKHQSSILVGVFAAATFTACGSVSNNPKPDGGAVEPGDFTIAVDPGTLSLTIAGSGTVAVDVTRGTNFADGVSLSATGMPAGVTAAFDLMTIPGGVNSANLTLTVANNATPGTSTVTVTGASGSLSHTATVELTLSTITVAGKLRSPQMGVTVRIVGKTATTTDASGNFSFTDVIVPYDIYVIGGEGAIGLPPIPAVNYYKGLTRTDPVVEQPSQVLLGGLAGLPKSMQISGTRSGGNASDTVSIFWETGGAVTTQAGNTTAYSGVQASWFSSDAKTARLFGIQISRGAQNRPTGYPGYGKTMDTVMSGVNKQIDLTLAAPATASLTGTITPPAGYPTPTVTLTQKFGDKTYEIWPSTATTDATSTIPLIAEGTAAFHGISIFNNAKSSFVYPALNAAKDLTFSMPTPMVMTGPVNSATNVRTSTPFEYTFPDNSLFEVSMIASTAHYHVFTATGSVTIPNVPELPLPAATSFTWTVGGWGPGADVNLAADEQPANMSTSKAEFMGSLHWQLEIPSRTFTSQ